MESERTMKETESYDETIYFVDCPYCDEKIELGVNAPVNEEFKWCPCGNTFMIK